MGYVPQYNFGYGGGYQGPQGQDADPYTATTRQDAMKKALAAPSASPPTVPTAPPTAADLQKVHDQNWKGLDEAKFNAALPKLGAHTYMDDLQGGGFWDAVNGPAPQGWVWNANGQPITQPGWDKAGDIQKNIVIGGLTGGAKGAVAGGVGTALQGATDKPAGYDLAGNQAAFGNPATLNTVAGSTGTGTSSDTSSTSTVPAGDTNGYAAPQYTAANSSPTALPGWDQTKWGDTAHQSPKYVVGHILSQYSPTVDNMDTVVAEIAKAYPGATRSGTGDVTIPGVGTIDIMKGADVGGQGWQWDDGSGGDASGTGANGLTSGAGYDMNTDAAMNNSLITKIIASLSGHAGGTPGIASMQDVVGHGLGLL